MGKSERLIGGNDHVCTPEVIWGPVVKHFGPIALDPFSNPHSKVPAKLKITNWKYKNKPPPGVICGDGLQHDWLKTKGIIWLNGPYSILKPWMAKAHETAQHKIATQEQFLFVPVRTSGSAWQKYGFFSDATCFLDFRVKHDGEAETAPFHQALIYYGARASHFEKVFRSYGTVFTQIRDTVYQRWPIASEHASEGDDSEDAA